MRTLAKGMDYIVIVCMGGEAEQIKATDGGYTADGLPYVVINFNQPWYMGGKKK